MQKRVFSIKKFRFHIYIPGNNTGIQFFNQLYGKTLRDKNLSESHLFSSRRILKLFLEFFNFLVLHFLIFTNIRKYDIKKF